MSEIYGRWDLLVGTEGTSYPSWVELTAEGGRFVGQVGSARPLAHVLCEGNRVSFSLPPQYESRKDSLVFEGELEDGRLSGTTTFDDGTAATWVGDPAPTLAQKPVSWGPAIQLIGSDLDNWVPRSPDWVNHWSISEELLVNADAGSDLVSVQKFGDFRLIAEYSYPKGSNSGIYLRGRYEFQILDDFESKAHGVGSSAAIYGFIAPSTNAIHAPEEWNTAEITLVGRVVTVVLNGVTVIDQEEIPGITGGALDSNEGEPGPFFVQGDHGPVTFRRLTVFEAIE